MKWLILLLAACLLTTAHAGSCSQSDVNNWNNCQGICCGAVFPPLAIACIACTAQAYDVGWAHCWSTDHNRWKRGFVGGPACPTNNQVFGKLAKGHSSFNRSTVLKYAKLSRALDPEVFVSAFDQIDTNGDGQVTLKELSGYDVLP